MRKHHTWSGILCAGFSVLTAYQIHKIRNPISGIASLGVNRPHRFFPVPLEWKRKEEDKKTSGVKFLFVIRNPETFRETYVAGPVSFK